MDAQARVIPLKPPDLAMPEAIFSGSRPAAHRTEARPRGATPHPRSGAAARGATTRARSSGSVGAGGPRGATPRSRSGGAAVRDTPPPR